MQEQQLQKNKRKLQFIIMKTDEKGRIIKALAGFYYIDDGEPSTQELSSMKLDSRGENGENSLAYLDTLRDNISQAILNKELNFVSSCWVDEASRTVKVGITEMKEEYIQRLKEFENMGPALDIFQQDLPVDE